MKTAERAGLVQPGQEKAPEQFEEGLRKMKSSFGTWPVAVGQGVMVLR